MKLLQDFFGKPNIFRIFGINLTFLERVFWKPNLFRVLIKNQTFVGHGSYIPNIITVLREIHGLAVTNYTTPDKSKPDSGLDRCGWCGMDTKGG